ncbi:hypothetical protein QNM97_05475 [Gordonia sp. L191]|uniref:hypothetical protein n=1 Tax=Gordonia sp. L191 TaxID=2982699 RepID=UPI0024BF5169|nr:hypothetical protein [Gordonia sp. L191]WHU48457.1 hypothetical protein QNM97_05475 [Gordonia sp. L191]
MTTEESNPQVSIAFAVVGGVGSALLAVADVFAFVGAALVFGLASVACANAVCHSEGNADMGIKIVGIGAAIGGGAAVLGYLWAVRTRRRIAALMPLAGLAVTAIAVVTGTWVGAPTR